VDTLLESLSEADRALANTARKGAESARIELDGVELGESQIGQPFAVDPGDHKIEATAKGKLPRSYVVRSDKPGLTEIVIERLDDIPVAAGLAEERISFKAWHAEDEDVVKFLRFVREPANQPVFVHCQWGADRTGMMIAIERIAIEGWTKDAAIEEVVRANVESCFSAHRFANGERGGQRLVEPDHLVVMHE
jgi:hypothetical protein